MTCCKAQNGTAGNMSRSRGAACIVCSAEKCPPSKMNPSTSGETSSSHAVMGTTTIMELRRAVPNVPSNSLQASFAARDARKGKDATPAACATTPTGTIMIRRA